MERDSGPSAEASPPVSASESFSDAYAGFLLRLGVPFFLGFGGLIVSLLSLEQGQSFPQWMLLAYLVFVIALCIKGVELSTQSTFLAQTRLPTLVAALGVVFLGVGIGATAHAARPESVGQKTIADVSYQIKSGNYALTASDGTYYWLGRDSFQPPLPDLTDHRYVGRPAWITIDQGSKQVLKISLEETEYVSGAYSNPGSLVVKGILIAIVLVLIGGLTFAVSLIRAARRAARLDTRQ